MGTPASATLLQPPISSDVVDPGGAAGRRRWLHAGDISTRTTPMRRGRDDRAFDGEGLLHAVAAVDLRSVDRSRFGGDRDPDRWPSAARLS